MKRPDEQLAGCIITDRMTLRPWQLTDAECLFRYASDQRVSDIALWPRHTSVEMSRDVISRFFIPNDCNFAIELNGTGEVIGCIGLVPAGEEHYPAAENEREVGYWIGYPHWGKGLATEALNHLIRYCGDHIGLRSLLLTTDCRNTRSQRVAEKCGFTLIDRYSLNDLDSLAYRRPLL